MKPQLNFHLLYLQEVSVNHISKILSYLLTHLSTHSTNTSIFNTIITVPGTDSKISLKMSTRYLKATTYITKIQKEKYDKLLKKHEKAIQRRMKRITWA